MEQNPASAVMLRLYWPVVVKRERSVKVSCQFTSPSTSLPTHKLWVMIERMPSWIQAAEISSLRKVTGLRDRLRGLIIWEGLRAQETLV